MAEQNIEVDKNDNQIGLRPRGDFYTGKFIHRASHLILFNSKNKILLQHRSSTKKWYPNLFTYFVSGTVANESYEDCIEKEMQEEIGISINVKRLFAYPFFDTYDKAWHCVFVGKTDNKITQRDVLLAVGPEEDVIYCSVLLEGVKPLRYLFI